MADLWSRRAADNTRMMRSRVFSVPASATYNVFQVPRKTFVKKVYLYISTAVGAGGTISVGTAGNNTTASTTSLMSTVTSAATATGFKMGVLSYWFDVEPGYITLTVTHSGAAAGVWYLFADYTVIH